MDKRGSNKTLRARYSASCRVPRPHKLCLALFALCATPSLFSLCVPVVARDTATPVIERVEPPNWWVNHSVNTIQLLIYGRNLQGATASANYKNINVVNITVNEHGTYAFVSLEIKPGAIAGSFDIRIQTANGNASARFALKAPLSSSGRFMGFTPDDVIYLIMPDRFNDGDQSNNDPQPSRGMYMRANPRGYHGGDLQGIIDRLPYLKDLGVTAIWMTPVYDNTNRLKDYSWGRNVTDYHGYGAIDFYKVEDRLGTLDKLRELVNRAHAAGIKVIQDQVANHTGPDHPWAADQPTPAWLNGTPAKHLDNVFDIKSVTEENPNRDRFEATIRGWFGGTLPDINQDDPQAARYLIQNALWWIGQTGMDGIRQDTFPYTHRRFWKDWNAALQRQYPRLAIVGEVFDQRPDVVAFFQGGRARFDGIDSRLHSLFDFPSYFAIRDVFIKGQPISRLADVLSNDYYYTNASVLVPFLGNHDVPRFMSQPEATINGLKLAFTYLLTMRGTPQIYYGDEIAMHGGDDPDNRRDFPGGFPNDQRNAFTRSGRNEEEQNVFNHVRSILKARARHPALRTGKMRVLVANDKQLAYMREINSERVIVLINNSDSDAKIEVDISSEKKFAWSEIAPVQDGWRGYSTDGKITVPLGPRESKILQEQK